MNRTKIICTIGPSVNSLEMIEQLIDAGMNVARLNFSHGTHEEHLHTIELLKEARKRKGVPLAIMLDTKGPEIRLGKIKGGSIQLQTAKRWKLVEEEVEGDEEKVTLRPGYVLENLEVGMRVLFDDGYILSRVVEVGKHFVIVEIDNDGVVRSGKGVNVPNADLKLPAVTEKDIADIKFGCANDIDYIAASFVRSALHILTIKKLLDEEKKHHVQVLAKIENSEGIANFDGIVQAADGILVARGDLGVEVPLSQVPKLQKIMIRKSLLAGKPSITATQMLESMIHNPRPTRAEASDVANAIYDGTSAVMLSGETAIGKYPIEAVKVMESIIKETEQDFDYRAHFDLHGKIVYNDVPSSVTLAAVKTAYSSNAEAIFAFTSSGLTARLTSRLRPSMPIIAMTPSEKCYNQLSLCWGVKPFLGPNCQSIGVAFDTLSLMALDHKLLSYGDLVVVVGGAPFGVSGTSNMMLVESIGNVLVRGQGGFGLRIYGNVILALSPEAIPAYAARDQILVIAYCNELCYSLVREAAGVILQNSFDDTESEKYLLDMAKKYEKTIIMRADAASAILKEGQLVTLDPEKSLVYKGVVF